MFTTSISIGEKEDRDLRLKMIILSLVYVECDYFFLVGSDPLPQ